MPLLFILTLFFKFAISTDFGDLVKTTVRGNEAVLYNCSSSEDLQISNCYLDLFRKYNLNVTSLPGSETDPFQVIRYDATNMCKNYKALKTCANNDGCFNYNTFRALLNSEIDAEYYVSQTGFLEFYCFHGSDFILYYECMQTIELDDLSETIFTECSELEVGTCDSVSKTTQCERAVVRKSCISLKAINAYCQYQKILTSMTGWNQCEYMPCVNFSSKSTSFFMIFLIIYVYFLHRETII